MDDGLGNVRCFELLRFIGSVQRFGALPLSSMDCAARWMTSWLSMDELRAVCRASIKTCFPDAPLRSGNRPKPQHWKLDESTEVEETPAEEDQDWNDDIDADWTIDSEGRSSLSEGSVCALVASDGQASLRRSISETDLLVSEEEVNQTFACWKEDLVGIIGLCGPFVDKLLLANVRDHGWDTGQYLSEVLVAGFEESEPKTGETYRKVFPLGTALHCLACTAWCGDLCLVCRECVLGDASRRGAPSAGLVWMLRTPSILCVLRRVAS